MSSLHLLSTSRGAVTVLAVLYTCAFLASAEETTELSTSTFTTPECDFFVGLEGDDDEEGTEIKYPKQTIKCALDANCNNGLEKGMTVCILPGTYEVYDTIRPGCSFQVNIRAYKAHTVTLDAMGQGGIMSVGRTPSSFYGIDFTGGKGTTGAGVYGEAHMEFYDCTFVDNEADVDGAAVMVMRTAKFVDCDFVNNQATFGGAVRISDIGGADFKGCKFIKNIAERKGGALITQIETPDTNRVLIEDTLFCFNESPEGKHIFNFRDATHECVRCQFNSKACCSNHGRVVKDKDAANVTKEVEGEGAADAADAKEDTAVAKEEEADKFGAKVVHGARSKCECEEGWAGETCDKAASKDEL